MYRTARHCPSGFKSSTGAGVERGSRGCKRMRTAGRRRINAIYTAVPQPVVCCSTVRRIRGSTVECRSRSRAGPTVVARRRLRCVGTMLGRWSTEQLMRPYVRGTVKLMRMMTKTTLRRTAGTAVNQRAGERSR